jgi:thioredoxin 1
MWIAVGLLAAWLVYAFYKRYKMLSAINKTPESDKVKILTDATFKKATEKGVSLVDFWAEWCTPCKIQGPIVNQIAEELGDTVNVCKLDVQNNRQIANELFIKNIPTIIIFKDGKIFQTFVGVKPKPVLIKALKKALK